MIRRPPRSTRVRSSAASDVYKRQNWNRITGTPVIRFQLIPASRLSQIPSFSVPRKTSEALVGFTLGQKPSMGLAVAGKAEMGWVQLVPPLVERYIPFCWGKPHFMEAA